VIRSGEHYVLHGLRGKVAAEVCRRLAQKPHGRRLAKSADGLIQSDPISSTQLNSLKPSQARLRPRKFLENIRDAVKSSFSAFDASYGQIGKSAHGRISSRFFSKDPSPQGKQISDSQPENKI
jgi:hypothetical protein